MCLKFYCNSYHKWISWHVNIDSSHKNTTTTTTLDEEQNVYRSRRWKIRSHAHGHKYRQKRTITMMIIMIVLERLHLTIGSNWVEKSYPWIPVCRLWRTGRKRMKCRIKHGVFSLYVCFIQFFFFYISSADLMLLTHRSIARVFANSRTSTNCSGKKCRC